MFTSAPLIPTQPDLVRYDISKLDLFPVFRDRADYLAQTGQVAPAFDPNRRRKFWFDSSVVVDDDSPTPYHVVKLDATGIVPLEADVFLMPYEAGTVNLPDESNPNDPKYAAAMAKPAREVPIRRLMANEVLSPGSPFDPVQILRTDKVTAAPASDAPFGASDRALLQKIAAKLGV